MLEFSFPNHAHFTSVEIE